jgi:hypothetical protein
MSNLNDIVGEQKAPAPVETKKSKVNSEIDELDKQIKEAELLAKQMELKERAANLQDLEERLAERELKRENKRQRSLTNGQTLKQLAQNDAAAQRRCNHRKGGNGAQGVVAGQGDDSQYAVLKHTFANGDMWVRCLRCGKTWKPPIKDDYESEAQFLKAVVEYETAVNFQTRNVPSGSVTFRFSDNGAYYREVTKATNLR